MKRHPSNPADVAARHLAQSEFERPVAVEAGAGTGKTTVLVARILSWCLGRGWAEARWELIEGGVEDPDSHHIAAQVLDGLVAITFTEAAAAQMAHRVAAALTSLAADPESGVRGFEASLLADEDRPRQGQRARALIGALDHLAVRTIHSHCLHLLSTYPMAARLAPDLRVDAEGRHLDEIVREIVENATRAAYGRGADDPLHRLALKGVDPRQVAQAIQTLVADGFSSEQLAADPLSEARRKLLLQRLIRALEAVEPFVAPLAAQNRAQADRQVAEIVSRSLEELRAGCTDPTLPGLARLLDRLRELWDSGSTQRLRAWSKGDFTKTVERLFGETCDRLRDDAGKLSDLLFHCHRIDAETLDAGRLALQPLILAVEERLRARGLLTYASLMSEAWRLMANHPAVLRRERHRLRQLLVDEFQDTDRLQCELVRHLALGGEKSERPGLFVVGDPKQSIYGWRNADLEAYEHFLEDLRAAGGIRLQLTSNFRSVPPILQEVDRAVAPVMRPEPGLQPEFVSLQPWRDLADDPGFDRADRAPVEYWVSWGERGADTTADEAARLEAEAIARDIRELHDSEEVPWSEFGLLLRSTTRLETFLEAFRANAVPFVVTSDKHYYRRREVIEAAGLVRTLVVPVDHLALMTFIRSATVGVPDAALLPLWQGGFPDLVTRLTSPADPELSELRDLIHEVAERLPPDIPGLERIEGWPATLMAALENVAVLRQAFEREPTDRFIERLRERFLFDITESARHLGLYRLANLDRFFRQLELALEELSGDIQGVLRALRRSVAESEEAEQALPEGAIEDAVQVMTIHGAKGLEFGHVYLPQLHTQGRGTRQAPPTRADRRWIPGQVAEYMLFGSPTPEFDKVEEREDQVTRTEQVRTLYVALTRARQRLVLLGKWPANPTSIADDIPLTYVDLLCRRSGIPQSISDLRDDCYKRGASELSRDDALWRFPRLAPARSSERKKEEGSGRFPTRRDLNRLSSRLKRARQGAARRAQLAYVGSASDEAQERLERQFDEENSPFASSEQRTVGRTIGIAFHRLLETWDWQAEADSELERQRQIQTRWLDKQLSGAEAEQAGERFAALARRFRDGPFWDRFLALAPLRPAREVPVLLPPLDPDAGPVGYTAGFIDLLYRDATTGDWVIVDYKTDELEESEIAVRATAYEAQEAVYARAVREALDLETTPRAELWFIWPGIRWEASTLS